MLKKMLPVCSLHIYSILVVILGLYSSINGELHQFAAEIDDEFFKSEELGGTNYPCPCSHPLLCMPLADALERSPSAPHVQEFIKKSQKNEVFAFVVHCNASVWWKFNWTKLTTIALAGFYDEDLLCHAHEHGVRVVKLGNFPTSKLPNDTARHNWVKLQISDATLKFLDGINIDFEDAINPNSPEQKGLTDLVRETAEMFHSSMPGSQVSFDVAWSASGIDGRYYDYKSIANYSDLIFIMAYDEQSQIIDGPCTARPNSGIYMTGHGILTYLDLDIPGEKMILGVPWYGYNYPCLSLDTDSDGQQHQMQYDDERSLVYKYMLATSSGLRGVGMWTANFLDYSDTAEAISQQQLMWSLLP
ncbi:di-N-acetylchitobiase-like isoform X2 [Homarus americanus]|uniref:di-N-acetylchitobiase-like isoform X2 n=1 Tax=Homarus americanus TaxID=6706 RepID=UPI001C4385C3|nr:di-N-acetylchitobiase-like isoform X2 [Homarus americanus]